MNTGRKDKMDYITFTQVSKFENAMIHFGMLGDYPGLATNSQYHEREVTECLKELDQFPCVSCDERLTHKGQYKITIRWTMGERYIMLPPRNALAAAKWAEEKGLEYYEVKE